MRVIEAAATAAIVGVGVFAFQHFIQVGQVARKLRRDLIGRASTIHGTFYVATQHYWRATGKKSAVAPAETTSEFEHSYQAFSIDGSVFEQELVAWFGHDSTPRIAFHQIRDLLTVRYFDLKGDDTTALRVVNALGHEGAHHSGLTADQLNEPLLLLKAYHEAATAFGRDVLAVKLQHRP